MCIRDRCIAVRQANTLKFLTLHNRMIWVTDRTFLSGVMHLSGYRSNMRKRLRSDRSSLFFVFNHGGQELSNGLHSRNMIWRTERALSFLNTKCKTVFNKRKTKKTSWNMFSTLNDGSDQKFKVKVSTNLWITLEDFAKMVESCRRFLW